MTNREVAFHDAAVVDINDFIAVHPPERGGALLGPVGQPVVSRFLPDPRAAVTGVTYTPSQALRDAVAQIERSGVNLELKGIIHSHPSGMAHPSGGDHRAFADTLAKAPWLGRGIFPIVTASARREADEGHRVLLRGGVMSVFVAEARVGGAVQVEPARPRVIPFSRDVAVLASGLGASVESAATITAVGDTLYAAAVLRSGATEVTALFPPLYPMAPPLVLLTRRGEDDGTSTASRVMAHLIGDGQSRTVALPLAWDVSADEQGRLAAALAGALERIEGTRGARPTGSPADSPAGDGGDSARDGLRARLDGAVGDSLRKTKVLLVGMGSGGSQTAEALARASVEQFILIDPDQVGPENLSRSVYQFADVGKDKTQALTERLTAINPAVDARQVTASLDDISDEELAKLVGDSSLVIAATDDPKAQLRLNHVAWTLGVPAVFGGVYARGAAGEVIFTVPQIPGVRCFQCATAGRRDGASQGEMNYGTGQLIAEPALGSDISHIVMASVKIAIGLLELGTGAAPHSAGNLVATALAKGYQYVILSTVPGYDFFPRLFGETAGQHGYQSVWMSVAENPECSTCGVSPLAVGEYITSGPDLSALRPIASPDPEDGQPDGPSMAAGEQLDGPSLEDSQAGSPAPATGEQPAESDD